MFKEKVALLKESFNNKTEGKDRKKTTENLIVLGIILIGTVIFINYIWKGDSTNKNQASLNKVPNASNNSSNTDNVGNIVNEETQLETKLENMLSKISGVGDVKVMVTYSQSSKTIPLYNEDIQATTTEEKDTSGGTRKITENNSNREVVYDETSGTKSVITQSVVSPKIEGAIIVAKGTTNATVKNNIVQAVEAVTGLATHKIQVFEME